MRLAIAMTLVVLACACAADPGDDPKTGGTDSGGGGPIDSGALDSFGPHDTAPSVDTGTSLDSTHPADTGSASDSTSRDTSTSDTGVGVDSTDSTTDVVAVDASCPTCPLTVRYECMDTLATSNESKPWLRIVNNGTSPQPLSELTVRYWFTIDGDKPLVYHCDYAKIDCANVTGTFVTLTTPVTNADHYLELSFSAGAGSIAPGSDSGEIQNRFNKSDYSTWSQTNDYSFDPTKTTYADWPNVTLYRAGALVWGTEPS
jgi:hypothetical protein